MKMESKPMNSLSETDNFLRSQFEKLQKESRRGSVESMVTLAFSGARCAELLTELLISGNQSYEETIERAAEVAQAWPISYPALDDGRTNRLAEQIPRGLKRSLKITRSSLKATGRRVGDHPEVSTFLDHALRHENLVPFGNNGSFELASIMGALIVLHKECVKGNSNAATVVAMFGVRISKFLEDLLDYRLESNIRKALRSAAMKVQEWPIRLGHKTDLKQLRQLVPKGLGKGMGFRIYKEPGTLGDRDFDPETRLGFAFTYLQDMERTRDLAQRYDSRRAALAWELARQGRAAYAVLFNKHYQMARPHAVTNIVSMLIGNFRQHAGSPIAMAPPHFKEIVGIIKKLLDVVPSGTGTIWHQLRDLPDFQNENVDVWWQNAMLLAHIRCRGEWEQGAWPDGIRSAAKQLVLAGSGAKYCYKETVGLWIRDGFLGLADGDTTAR